MRRRYRRRPAPAITTRRSTITRWITEEAFIRAASTTTAVPCWSSCITGMSNASTSRRSTSKQRGAEMSSRLIAPKEGAIAVTAATISSGSVVLSTIGTESSPAKDFISADLPSMTGSEAFGPIFPSPSTAVPSEITATTRDAQVYSRAAAGSVAIRLETPATPGVYSIDRSRRSASGARSETDNLPPRCAASTSSAVKSARRGERCRRGWVAAPAGMVVASVLGSLVVSISTPVTREQAGNRWAVPHLDIPRRRIVVRGRSP